MTPSISFWIILAVGVAVGWKSRGYFGKKFSFLGFIKNPFKEKKKKKPRILSDDDDNKPDDDKTVVDKAKSTVSKLAGFLAKPIEKFMGNEKDEEDDE